MKLEFKRNNPHAIAFEKSDEGVEVSIGSIFEGEFTELNKKEIVILIEFLKACIATEENVKPESKDLTVTIRKSDNNVYIGINGQEEEIEMDYFLSMTPDEFKEEIRRRVEFLNQSNIDPDYT